MADVKAAPAVKGDIKQAGSAMADGEKIITNSRPATGSVVKGSAVGSGDAHMPSDGVVLEGLGDLNGKTKPSEEDDTTLGSGEYVVVLHDYVAGVGKGYVKGDVRRISNFITGYGDETRVDEARANAKRLFDLKALRLAAPEENGQGHVEVNYETDGETRERNKRIELEKQIEELKKMQSLDKDAVATVPNVEENWK